MDHLNHFGATMMYNLEFGSEKSERSKSLLKRIKLAQDVEKNATKNSESIWKHIGQPLILPQG